MVTDSNGTKQDSPPEKGQASTEGKETSGGLDIFTKEDVDKIRSDALAEVGRERKKASTYEKELAETKERLGNIEAEADKKAYEAVKDDSSGLAVFKREQEIKTREKTLKDERTQFDQDKADHADLLAASEKTALLLAVSDIATEFAVNKDSILKFKPKTPEDAREIAQAVKDLGGIPQGVKAPDPGIGSGAGMNFDKMSAEEKILYAVEHPKKTS